MQAVSGASPSPRRLGPAAAITLALDILIAIQVLVLLAIGVAGGFDLAWAHAHQAAKPALILLICAAVRLACPTPSYQLAIQSSSQYHAVQAVWQRVRVPPALSDVLGAVLVTRVATVALAFLSNILFPDRQFRPFAMPFRSEKFAEIFAAWDSGWYFDIARHGYYANPNGQSSIAFFPLYPMLMRALAAP